MHLEANTLLGNNSHAPQWPHLGQAPEVDQKMPGPSKKKTGHGQPCEYIVYPSGLGLEHHKNSGRSSFRKTLPISKAHLSRGRTFT